MSPSERVLQAKATIDARIADMRERSPDDSFAMESLDVLERLAEQLITSADVMDAVLNMALIENELAKLREYVEANQ